MSGSTDGGGWLPAGPVVSRDLSFQGHSYSPCSALISAAAPSSWAPYPSLARELKSAQHQTSFQCFYPLQLRPASADPVCHPDEFLLHCLGHNPVPTQPHPHSVLPRWLHLPRQCHRSPSMESPWCVSVCVVHTLGMFLHPQQQAETGQNRA